MEGSIYEHVYCPRCHTLAKVVIPTAAAVGPQRTKIGDELGRYEEHLLQRPERAGFATFLEGFECPGCGPAWVLCTAEEDHLVGLEGISLEEGLDRANYVSRRVFEAFTEGTKYNDEQDAPADWASSVATRAPVQGPLEEWPWHYETRADGPDLRPRFKAVADDIASLAATPAAHQFGAVARVFEFPSGTRCAPAELASEGSPRLTDYAATQDDDTWVVGRNADDLWQFVPGAHLRAWIRQACIARGVAPPAPYPDDYPCGLTVAGGAWTIVCLLAGAPERGVYLAMARDSSYALATLTSPQRDPLAAVEARLARRDDPRLTPLVAVGPVEGASDALVALVEPLPDGHPLSTWWIPFRGDDACDLAAALLRYLAMRPTPVGGLRPETIFVTRGTAQPWPTIITGLAPRGEAFMAGQAPRSVGSVTPYRYLYDAPEVLRGGPPTLASDVFAATAVIAHMATGAHPFEGESAFMQLSAIVGGQRRAYRGPPALEALIARGLAADPAQRPSAAELAAAFAAAVPLPPG